MMIIDNRYELEQEVYLKTDTAQLQRIVTAISIHPNGQLIYTLACATDFTDHYEFEMSAEINEVIKVQ